MTTVLTEIRDQVGILTLNRPRAINALTREMIDILYATLQDWASNDRASPLRLVGAGEPVDPHQRGAADSLGDVVENGHGCPVR